MMGDVPPTTPRLAPATKANIAERLVAMHGSHAAATSAAKNAGLNLATEIAAVHVTR
jgi:hypothetical protein